MRTVGTVSRGIRMPILRQGDNLVNIVCENFIAASVAENFEIKDRDILGVTEAVVARAQGNYATVEQMAADIKNKFGGGTLGVVFPIFSRNRFSILLKAISMSSDKVIVQFSYPCDEVGNSLVSQDIIYNLGINPYASDYDYDGFRRQFGKDTVHRFTGIDYIEYYKSLGDNIEIVFSNDPAYILKYTKNVLNCDIHTRIRTQKILKSAGAEKSYRLDQILNSSTNGSGWSEYGLLGSNKASDDKVKLFPRDTADFVKNLQTMICEKTGKKMEILVYGDGGFKDPVGGIWELADPVISPAYTEGLRGTPNEIKIKYLADNKYSSLSGEELNEALRKDIKAKEENLYGKMSAEGTTPRQLSDLIGSLCDLMSGSGDKGTPVIHISGYFDNFATE